MKIACIGWGSLVWNPLGLKIEKEWYKDGPLLPIEFTRISRDDRVTLIIDKEAKPIRTLWAFMTINEITEARESLRAREKTSIDNIYFITAGGDPINDIESKIKEWLLEKNLGAAIWTGLSYSKKTKNQRPSCNEIVNHLKELKGQELLAAKEYVIKAPEQIMTIYRREIEEILNWTSQRGLI